MADLCEICGSEILDQNTGPGRRKHFCSRKCMYKAHNATYAVRYQKMLDTHEDYRTRRNRQNSESNKRCRELRKNTKLTELSKLLAATSDVDTVREILDENFRLKGKLYARAVRVSEEGS